MVLSRLDELLRLGDKPLRPFGLLSTPIVAQMIMSFQKSEAAAASTLKLRLMHPRSKLR